MNKIKTRAGFEIIFAGTVLFSFLLWLFFIFADGANNSQFAVFFMKCNDFIADCTNVTGYSALLDPYHNLVFGLAEKAYPPLSYVCMYCMSRLTCVEDYAGYIDLFTDPRFMMIFILLLMMTTGMLFVLIRTIKEGNELTKNMIGVAVLVSAPMLFSYERGNTIVITAVLCMFFVCYYNSKNRIVRELSYVALAIAIAFKMTPALLGILIIYDKNWKATIRIIVYGIIAVFGPFIFLQGGFTNIPLMFHNITLNLQQYTSVEGCTFAAFVNHYVCLMNPDYVMSDAVIKIIQIGTYVASAFLLMAAPFATRQWEKIGNVVIVLIMMPSHSGYYCLLYLIPVIVLFLNESQHTNIDFIYLFSFIIISWVYVCAAQEILHYTVALTLIAVALIATSAYNIAHIRGKSDEKAFE